MKHVFTPDRKAEESEVIWTLGPWTEKYISERPVKEGTKRQLRSAARTFCEFLGADLAINTITIKDSAKYRVWMEKEGNQHSRHTRGLSKNTVRKKITRAKENFKYAVKEDLIVNNRFRMETRKLAR